MRFQKRKPLRLLINAERQERIVEAVFNHDMLHRHNERASWRRQILEASEDKIDALVLLALFEKFSKENVFDVNSAIRELVVLEKCVKDRDNLCKDLFACAVLAEDRRGYLSSEYDNLIKWAQDFPACFYSMEMVELRNIPKDWISSLALAWFNVHFDEKPFKMEVVK